MAAECVSTTWASISCSTRNNLLEEKRVLESLMALQRSPVFVRLYAANFALE